MATPIISIIGWHNVGKTTFIERLIAELKQRGLRIAAVKHTRGDFQIDHEGTDTWRYAQAGSDIVVIAGRDRVAIIDHVSEELSLDLLTARLPQNLDLIVTEGFKRASTPKIEVISNNQGEGPIAQPEELLAIVSNTCSGIPSDVPCFTPTDIAGIVGLLEEHGLISHQRLTNDDYSENG